jgi:hypothetical protein
VGDVGCRGGDPCDEAAQGNPRGVVSGVVDAITMNVIALDR